MVERRVDIDVNYEGVDEARASLEELDEAIRESSTDIRTLSSDVQNLANSLERLNQNAAAVRTHMENVSDRVSNRDRYVEPERRRPEPPRRTGGGRFSGGVWVEESPTGKQFPDNVRLQNLSRGLYETSEKSLDRPSSLITQAVDKNGISMARAAISRILEKEFNVIIAKAGREVVGALSYTLEDLGNYTQMDIREVGAKYIGHGVGPRMVADAIAKAKQKSIDLIKVSNALPNAHNTYLRAGFEMPNMQDKGMYPTNMYMRLGKNIELASLEADPDERYDRLRSLLNKSARSGKEEAMWFKQGTQEDITPEYKAYTNRIQYFGMDKYRDMMMDRYHVHRSGILAPSVADLQMLQGTKGMSGILTPDNRVLEMLFQTTTNMKGLINDWGKTYSELRKQGASQDIITKTFMDIANKHSLQTNLFTLPKEIAVSPFGYMNKPYVDQGMIPPGDQPPDRMMGDYKEPSEAVQASQRSFLRIRSPMLGMQDDVQLAQFIDQFERRLGPQFGVKMRAPGTHKEFGDYTRLLVVTEDYLTDLDSIKKYISEAWDSTLQEVEMRVDISDQFQLQNTNLYKKTPSYYDPSVILKTESLRKSRERFYSKNWVVDDQKRQDQFWQEYMGAYGAKKEPSTPYKSPLAPNMDAGEAPERIKPVGTDIGKVIDNLASRGGTLGRLSWTFTSLAMSALGVYFSLMSVVNMLSQGIMAVFNPLQNLQGAIQGYAIGQMKLKNGVADLDKYFESLGIGIGDVAEGSLRFQSILGGFQTSLAAFGAKLMLDPDVWENLQGILAEVQDFLTREETFTLVKGIIAALRDSLPDILEAFMFIGEVVRTMLPYAGLFAKAWAAALVIMPVASFASALLNIGKAVATLIGLFGALKTAIATSTAVSNLGTLGTLGAVGKGAAVGAAGIGILHNIGALSAGREYAYNVFHDESIKPYQHQKIPWWDLLGGITGSPTFRAGGGPLRAGQMAVVGEKGPEIIIPKGDVDVVPNHKVRFLADGTGMQSYQMHEANRLVESNTDAIEGSTRATQELVDIFKRYQVEGTSAVRATGNSPAGGPTSETLGNAGPFTMSGGGKTWNMDTRVGLGEGIYKTSGSDVFSGDGLTVPTVPEAEGGGLLDMNTALIMGTIFGPGALKKLGGLKGIKGGLKGLGGKLGGLLGRGAKVGAPAMLEIDEMLGMGARGAETFEILGKPATMTARTGMGGMGALGTVAKLAGPVGAALGMMEMLRIGAPAAGFSNEQLTAGNTKEFNDYLAAFHKDSKEGTEDTNMLLSSINSTLQSTDKTLTGAFGTNGAGTEAGNGGGPGTGTGLEGTPNPVPTLADGYSYIGNHFMNGPNKENPWATGLTGNPIIDFAPGGEGWNRDYGAGDMYGPGGSAGAPSVKYNYDPYYPTQPGSNRDEWSQVNDKGARSGTGWSFTTPFKDTETYDFNKIQTVTDKNKGMLTMGGESTLIEKAGFDFAALEKAMKLSESTKAHEEWGANLDRSDFGYMNAEELRGAAEGAVGEIVTQGKDVFIRQADGSLKQIASAAAGGLLKAGGLINAHAGEVIGPLGQVASTIASAANITSNNSSASSQNISINITVNGNADQNVTDEMIRKIKKELFGRGVIA